MSFHPIFRRARRMLGALLCATLASCGGDAPTPPAPVTLPGVWHVAVDRTTKAVVGDAPLAEHPSWIVALTPTTYALSLSPDGTFTLRLAKVADGDATSLAGTWIEKDEAAVITLVSIDGEETPVEGRQAEVWRREGDHLVMPQGDEVIYFAKGVAK